MGKKSKRKTNTTIESSSVKNQVQEVPDEATLQELQTHINSLSLAEAMKAVKAATSSLNFLKEQQQKALEEARRAKQEILLASKIKQEHNDLYGNQEFWDQRYQENSIYEWYLPFEVLKLTLFPDLNSCSNLDGEILVAGCGNSTLCEDLWLAGYRLICGLDYSPPVIQTMSLRAKERDMTTLRYLQADACALPVSMQNYTCRAVIDKGTLDAIASGGGGAAEGGETAQNADKAIRYLKEMWRILQPGGRFLIVSTMPSDLFDLLVISIIPSKKYSCHSLRTPEDGEVFYYSLEKSESSRNDKAMSLPVTSIDLEALLKEAADAQKELEDIRQRATQQGKLRELAAGELSGAEKRKKELSEILSGQFDTLNESFSQPTPSKVSVQSTFQPPMCIPKKSQLPHVQLTLLSNESSFITGGYLSVEYILEGGEWDEDDFLSLHDFDPNHSPTAKEESISFEYTTCPEPILNGDKLRGVMKMLLPFHGGPFFIQYQRVNTSVIQTTPISTADTNISCEEEEDPNSQETHPNSSQNAIVSRENQPLASSTPFAITFLIQQEQNKVCRAQHGRGYQKNLSMRSNDSLTCNLTYLIEDLQNINSLSITIISKSLPKTSTRLTKPTCWRKNETKEITILTVECDVLRCDEHIWKEEFQSSWISIPIPNLQCDLLWNDSYGLVESDETSPSSLPWGNRIIIKIPYIRKLQLIDPIGMTAVFEQSNGLANSSSTGLHCRWCDSLLLPSSAISNIQALPSGLFDQVMHEYLCSETQPTMPLSMTDFTTPSGIISTGEIFFSIHPQDMRETLSHLQFSCKMSPSLLDVVGGSLGVKGLPQLGFSESSGSLSLVDASTCCVSCSRCLTVLGDGLIASDLNTNDHRGSEHRIEAKEVEEIYLSDLQDVRFLRSTVRWNPCGKEITWGNQHLIQLLTENCTVEQVLTNTFLWLVNRYDVTFFELSVVDWIDSCSTTLRLRLLSRSQKETNSQQIHKLQSSYSVVMDSKLTPTSAVKVSCRLCSSEKAQSNKNIPKPISIPISFSDYCEILDLLQTRREYFGSSFLPGEWLSFLCQ